MITGIILYSFLLLVIFYLLAKICDDYFIKSLEIIAKRLKLSDDVAGATFMAIGTSAPEFFTSLIAVITMAEDVGAGTIVGSAIFNILVIVGASAAVATAFLHWKPVIRDLGFYIVAIIFLLFTFIDGKITFWESLLYLLGYAVYIYILSKWRTWKWTQNTHHKKRTTIESTPHKEGYPEGMQPKEKQSISVFGKVHSFSDALLRLFFPCLEKKPHLYWLTFTISILFISILSWVMVESAVELAHLLGVPAVIISLTILAGGTSVPDLLSSLIVARQGRGDMAVSNAVGSNSFDILVGLGLPWFLYTAFTGRDVKVGSENLFSSVVLLFCTVLALFFILFAQNFKLGRKAGFLLVALYVGYLCYKIYGVFNPDALIIENFFGDVTKP